MNPFTDTSLSIRARGVLAYLLASGVRAFTVRDIQANGPNSLDEMAYALMELERRGFIVGAAGSYTVSDHPFWSRSQ